MTNYVRKNGTIIAIKDMSKSYLKNQIEFIKKTGLNTDVLIALQTEYKNKNILTFTKTLTDKD